MPSNGQTTQDQVIPLTLEQVDEYEKQAELIKDPVVKERRLRFLRTCRSFIKHPD